MVYSKKSEGKWSGMSEIVCSSSRMMSATKLAHVDQPWETVILQTEIKTSESNPKIHPCQRYPPFVHGSQSILADPTNVFFSNYLIF